MTAINRLRRFARSLGIGHRCTFIGQITVDAEGVKSVRRCSRGALDCLESSADFKWTDVRGIVAFKRDHMTVDLVCVAFELSNGLMRELDEDMVGYRELADQLPAKFSLDPSWEERVVLPPFATNWTVLWRAAPSAGAGPEALASTP